MGADDAKTGFRQRRLPGTKAISDAPPRTT